MTTTATAKTLSATKTTKKNSRGLRAACAGLAVALASAGALLCATPRAAYANDYSDGYADGLAAAGGSGSGYVDGFDAGVAYARHYEGEAVTIWPEGDTAVYAEWHKGASGKWWATFWTYNYTKVYAAPAPAGCGWTFHCYDANGSWTQIQRSDAESTTSGKVGPQGVSSHWQELDGSRWF